MGSGAVLNKTKDRQHENEEIFLSNIIMDITDKIILEFVTAEDHKGLDFFLILGTNATISHYVKNNWSQGTPSLKT